jgi:hypothetical protein
MLPKISLASQAHIANKYRNTQRPLSYYWFCELMPYLMVAEVNSQNMQ